MELYRNGSLGKFYRWSYVNEPPRDLCSFFWRMVWALLWLPLTWPTILPWTDCHDLPDRVLVGAVHYFIFALVLASGGFAYFEPWKFLTILGTAVGIGIIIIAGGIGYLLVTDTGPGNETVSLIRKKYSSFKDKYCPKIDWKW